MLYPVGGALKPHVDEGLVGYGLAVSLGASCVFEIGGDEHVLESGDAVFAPFGQVPHAVLTTHALAIANIAALGIPFSAFLVIPYALVGRCAKASGHAGKVMATMNLFMCLPELVVSLIVSPLVGALGGSLRLPMVVSGVACFAATGVIFFGFSDGWHGKWCARADER